MRKEIVFATNNPNKVREVKQMLSDTYVIHSLEEIGFVQDIPETEETLEGNALLKAQTIADFAKLPVLADDTGLEIDCLDGRPGVYSARYAGERCSPKDNMQKVLTEMEGESERKAKFRTVIAYISGDHQHLFEGKVEGYILHEKRGEEGFGYDPIFVPDGFDITFAEMSASQKNQISHRARAVSKMVEFLNQS